MRSIIIFICVLLVEQLIGQSQKNMGMYFTVDVAPGSAKNPEVNALINSLDSGTVVTVDSTKGGNIGFGIYFILSDLTLEMQMSTIPTQVVGNGSFSKLYNTLSNNTSIKSDSLDLFLMFSHFRLGLGYMFNDGGQFFFAPTLAYDKEVGRTVVKDDTWRRYDNNNHFTFTTQSNGVHIDDLNQNKSAITGVSLGLRTGLFIGRGWRSGSSLQLSFIPYMKYGWRTNTDLEGVKTTDAGRFSFYGVLSFGIGFIQKE